MGNPVLKSPIKIKTGNIHGTKYKAKVDAIRQETGFFKDKIFYHKDGLLEIVPSFDKTKTLIEGNPAAAFSILEVFKQINDFVRASQDVDNTYFAFGWPGYLSQKERLRSAFILFKELSEKLVEYKKQYKDLLIKVFAFSHGGNVALNLAQVFDMRKELNEKPILPLFNKKSQLLKKLKDCLLDLEYLKSIPAGLDQISELWLLATPIQGETSHYVKHNFFNNLVSLYSKKDNVQVADVFSTRFFSSRLLKSHLLSKKNVLQVQVVFSNLVPKKNNGPQHDDFWRINRTNFLEPIPIICFVPILRDLINKAQAQSLISPKTNLIFDFSFDPEKNLSINLYKNKTESIVSRVLPASAFKELREKLRDWRVFYS